MTQSLGKCRGVLLMLALISLGVSFAAHRFEPRTEPDSLGYLEYDWQTWMTNMRTFGYPLFLAGVRTLSDDPRVIPVAHWLALVLAVWVFFEGLVLCGYRVPVALGAAGTLLFCRGNLRFGPILVADSLASSLAIAAAGCFLATLASQPRRACWCGFVVFTFLCYQTRPAYLFLIPLWPIVALAADRLILRRDAGWLANVRRGASYALAALIPFVLFCSLRWSVVGHWGLVSFGGYNLIGAVGQFLDAETVPRLSAGLQPLAADIVDRRTRLATVSPPENMAAMEEMFGPTVWELAVPAAKALHGEETVAINRDLSQLSRELLRLHPRRYAQWLVWNGIYAVKQIILLTITDLGTMVLLLIVLGCHIRALWIGPPPATPVRLGPPGEASPGASCQRFQEQQLLCWTALGFTLAKSLLVILVEPATERYMTGAMVLLPAALAVALFHVWENAQEANGPGQSSGQSSTTLAG